MYTFPIICLISVSYGILWLASKKYFDLVRVCYIIWLSLCIGLVVSLIVAFIIPKDTRDVVNSFEINNYTKLTHCEIHGDVSHTHDISYIRCSDTIDISLTDEEIEFSNEVPENTIYIISQTPTSHLRNNFSFNTLYEKEFRYIIKKE